MLMMMAAIATQAGTAAPLTPTGKWTVEYAESMCVLSRDYGEPAKPVTVGFRPWPMGESTEMVLVTADSGPKSPRRGKAHLTLSPSGQTITGTYWSVWVSKTNRRLAVVDVKQAELDHLDTTAAITIAIDEDPPVTIAPHGIKAALAALAACDDDLLRGWGIDPGEDAEIATPAKAKTPEGPWLMPDDYPPAAIRAEQQGTSYILWTIALDGRARDCKTIASSGAAILDEAACHAITLRASYTPAIGRNGQPMISHKMRKVSWVMPR